MPQVGDDADAIHGIVQAQAPLFVGTENQPRSKLLVEIADCDVPAVSVEAGVAVADTFPAVARREAEHDVLVVFVAHARLKIAIGVREERKALT